MGRTGNGDGLETGTDWKRRRRLETATRLVIDLGTKTEGGRHDAALFSPSGLVRKRQIGPWRISCSLPLIFRTRFLHFTVNHYRKTS